MSFVKMNISCSRTSSAIFARFGCIISPLCEIILSAGAELAGTPEFVRNSVCNTLVYMSLKFIYIITKFHGRRLDKKCKKKSSLSDARPIVSHTVANLLVSNPCI